MSSSVDTSVACSPSTLNDASDARPRVLLRGGGPYSDTPLTADSRSHRYAPAASSYACTRSMPRPDK
eukprot:364731-Chlamydomonas_euryale.AAC.8